SHNSHPCPTGATDPAATTGTVTCQFRTPETWPAPRNLGFAASTAHAARVLPDSGEHLLRQQEEPRPVRFDLLQVRGHLCRGSCELAPLEGLLPASVNEPPQRCQRPPEQ